MLRTLKPLALTAIFTLALGHGTPVQAQITPADITKSTALTTQADDAAKKPGKKEAEALYLQAVALNSKNGPAWRGLARVTYDMGDLERAKTFYKEGWAAGDLPSLRTLAALALLDGEYSDFVDLIPDLMKQKNFDTEIRAMLVIYGNKTEKGNAFLADAMAGLDPVIMGQVSPASLKLFIETYDQLGKTKEADALRALQNKGASGTTPTSTP